MFVAVLFFALLALPVVDVLRLDFGLSPPQCSMFAAVSFRSPCRGLRLN